MFNPMEHVEATEFTEQLISKYPNDLPTSLTLECRHLAAHLVSQNIKSISASDLCLKLQGPLLNVYPYVHIALCTYLCLMATNCSGERSFSALRRVKNYLRSSQNQDRLNALSLLYIESDMTVQMNCDKIIDEFANAKSRKLEICNCNVEIQQ